MASLHESIRAALGDPILAELVGDRIYPGDIPDEEPEGTWLFYEVPEDAPIEDLEDEGDVRGEFIFHAFADTFAEAKAIIDAVKLLLNTYQGGQITRAFWLGTTTSADDDGHEHIARFDIWGRDALVVVEAGSRARITTGFDSITLDAGGHTFTLDSDGLTLDGLEVGAAPDLSAYARKDLTNTFTASQVISGDLDVATINLTTKIATASKVLFSDSASTANGTNLIALGKSITGNAADSIGIGQTITLGNNTKTDCVAIGKNCQATDTQAFAFGNNANATAGTTVAVGVAVTVSSGFATALGSNTTVAHRGIGLGEYANTEAGGDVVIGTAGAVPFVKFVSNSSNTNGRRVSGFKSAWIDQTDATRLGRIEVGAYSTSTFQPGVRVDANSGGVRLGFFGGTAAAKPSVTGSRGGNAALASLLTALANLGLITDSTTA